MVVVAVQWVVFAAAILGTIWWTPALLMLLWALPIVAVAGNRSLFGHPVYEPVPFLIGRVSNAFWLLGAVGLFFLIVSP